MLWLIGAVVTWMVITNPQGVDAVMLAAVWPLLWLWVVKQIINGKVKWTRKGR